ncbi:hypothetical protein TWF694_004493 [Orbilia ellipsospora]|uniref:ubiquitinyl hydrolase 1 n=1 Tax=Orbilia ellipsospora TaxID=2528407 RepID=A0AAV9WV97_9PEZI
MVLFRNRPTQEQGLTKETLTFIINHVVLPPKVPQEEESDIRTKNFKLLEFLETVAGEYVSSSSNLPVPTKAIRLLKATARIHDPGADFAGRLREAILNLEEGDVFAVHVFMQNAGLVFRRLGDSLQMEAFEASPLPGAVLGCKGRLRCKFPGPVTAIPWEEARDPAFLKELGNYLQHMDTEKFTAKTLSKSRKGGNDLSEERGTADPRYIVELFTGITRGIGTEVEKSGILKNLRDEVNWKDARDPWRRSGLWLVIRVALQSTLGYDEYKCFLLETIRAILDQAIKLNVDSYMLSCINRKLARRASKIGQPKIPQFLLERILKTSEEAQQILSGRWRQEISDSEPLVKWEAGLNTPQNIAEAGHIRLRNASSWIENRLEAYRNPLVTIANVKDPQEKYRHKDLSSPPVLSGGTEVEAAINLINFERWIERNLENWCSSLTADDQTERIRFLSTSIKDYHVAASKIYVKRNILDTSKMLLIIMEMWIQLDKAICKKERLLLEYSPEIPTKLLEPLLLINMNEMKRLQKVENYLQNRHSVAKRYNRSSIFSSASSRTSFAVQYYNQSTELQALRVEIVVKAETARENKKRELKKLNEKYRKLLADYQGMSCEERRTNRKGKKYHSHGYCDRCQLWDQIQGMKITAHEWPLPAGENEIKSTIFELKPPRQFATWRDLTYYILIDVCTTAPNEYSTTKSYCFKNWDILGSVRSNIRPRVTWSSQTKPISGGSHYSERRIPANESDILVKHAGQFLLLDTENEEWIRDRHETCSLVPLCTSKLSGTPYEVLAYAVNNTTHSHNEVISEQYKCPKSLTLHEYEAFSSLRSGDRLQWHNILIELRKGDLKFKDEPVFTLFLHAACHAGEATDSLDWRRNSHVTLSAERFSLELLKTLRQALSVLEDNWQQANTLKLLILLARRLLTGGHPCVKSEVISFLKVARKVCNPWVESIRDKLKTESDADSIQKLRYWLLRILGIQCSSFDVEEDVVPLVFESCEDIIQFLICQITIHENCLGILSKLPLDLSFLLEANRRLGITVEDYIQDRIRQNPDILFGILRKSLPTQKASGSWHQLAQPAERWWRLNSNGCEGSPTTIFDFNVLQGKLLIDGQPNGRLPENYFTHDSYVKLLGNRILDIIPSQMPGMRYQTKEKFYGSTLHFQMNGGFLIIRKQCAEEYEFIPADQFFGDLPRPLIESGSQWLNLSQGQVIFYQSDFWWADAPLEDDWILNRRDGNWVMERKSDKLIDIDSGIHTAAYQILGPIEAREYLITTINQNGRVCINLPKYELSFFINESHLVECESLKGWVVDPHQKLGTFIGLRTFLKLRSSDECLNKECVLVPLGSIKPALAKTGNHCVVHVEPIYRERTYTIYHIDKFLKQVRDDGTLRARYTRIYLHAVTSGIMEDPLTGRTGVDESLDLLKNAASFSFPQLHHDEACLLSEIGNLTPSRYFYPEHLREMQEVGWKKNMPAWVQHDEFYTAVRDILNDWNRRQFLIEGSEVHDVLEIGSDDLLERGRNISSAFIPGDPHAPHRHSAAVLHSPRNAVTDREAYVQVMSRASFQWEEKQYLDLEFGSLLMRKNSLPGYSSYKSLEYSSNLLGTPPSDQWCTLYELCRRATKADRFGLLFVFSYLVYDEPANRKFLQSLLAVAVNNNFNNLPIPPYNDFQLGIGIEPEISDIEYLLGRSPVPYELSFYSARDKEDYGLAYNTDLKNQTELAARAIFDQWPTSNVVSPSSSVYPLLDLARSMTDIRRRFETCYRNSEFSDHLDEVIRRLRNLRSDTNILKPFRYPTTCAKEFTEQPEQPQDYFPNLERLLKERLAPKDREMEITRPYSLVHDEVEVDGGRSLQRVVSVVRKLGDSGEEFTKLYAKRLLESIKVLKDCQMTRGLKKIPVELSALREHEHVATAYVNTLLSSMRQALLPVTEVQQLQKMSGVWPSITRLNLLQKLRLAERGKLSPGWKETIVALGEAITWEQRASRLVNLACKNLVQEFDREVRNPGRQNWIAGDQIDWLLLELDSEVLIRPVQASIGFSMMDSKNGNAVMQLNMGEGKSAIIIPAVAAALADTTRLVRPIVLKPLFTQAFHTLVQKLSSLSDRRVYYLPFGRQTNLSTEKVKTIQKLYEDCMRSGAIVLALPEHILSFKLAGVEQTIQDQEGISKPLISCQQWLSKNVRDILDESDEILHNRYQLIYTKGSQLPMEGGRDRWILIQELLDLVQEKAIQYSRENPTAIDVEPKKAEVKYRSIRVIDSSIGNQMLQEVASDICMADDDKVPSVSIKLKLLSPSIRELALRFISAKLISAKEQNDLFNVCGNIKTQLLVLRGLIVDGVLLFILRDKRCRVDYGLDRQRSNLAVPYRAKDRPAARAEFSHPEVVLVLTCLSYYYGGLAMEDLRICFDLLEKTDNPDLTYEYWIKCYPNIALNLSRLSCINLEDDEAVQRVFGIFRYNKTVIDFFLAEFVFPREAKSFPSKLSTSAWDLAERKHHNTTGFSGTNDNRYLLPTSIQQLDLPEQVHTNSLVLKNILLEENNSVFKAHKDNARLEAHEILAQIAGFIPRVQVLLDVGAQILELENCEVAEAWLKADKSSEIQGVVFFGDNDELLIMRRGGKTESFVTSALSKQLGHLLVFLDEAHTRGVDLVLPAGSRAAVMLGPNLVKDKFVQGCMRMRKLGNGHSLIFVASPDIYAQIQKSANKQPNELIDTSDVLLWTMLESCRQIEQGFSTWADQGLQYLTRRTGWETFQQNRCKDQLEEMMVEKDARLLIDMYGVGGSIKMISPQPVPLDEVQAIYSRLDQFGIKQSHSVSVQEEQERETEQEQELEIYKEYPLPAKPSEHSLDIAILAMALSGRLNKSSKAFSLAYSQYESTSARSKLDCENWTSELFATEDFKKTVELESKDSMDDYLRPVRWILSTHDRAGLLLLSPYEANRLFPVLMESKVCSLLCYAPRVTKFMRTFEYLNCCPMPGLDEGFTYGTPALAARIALNVFAGQLFFSDEIYYHEFCNYLGISYGQLDDRLQRDTEGWVSMKTGEFTNPQAGLSVSKFTRSPLPFLAEIVKMRRKGQGFFLTHLGSVLNARRIEPTDF